MLINMFIVLLITGFYIDIYAFGKSFKLNTSESIGEVERFTLNNDTFSLKWFIGDNTNSPAIHDFMITAVNVQVGESSFRAVELSSKKCVDDVTDPWYCVEFNPSDDLLLGGQIDKSFNDFIYFSVKACTDCDLTLTNEIFEKEQTFINVGLFNTSLNMDNQKKLLIENTKYYQYLLTKDNYTQMNVIYKKFIIEEEFDLWRDKFISDEQLAVDRQETLNFVFSAKNIDYFAITINYYSSNFKVIKTYLTLIETVGTIGGIFGILLSFSDIIMKQIQFMLLKKDIINGFFYMRNNNQKNNYAIIKKNLTVRNDFVEWTRTIKNFETKEVNHVATKKKIEFYEEEKSRKFDFNLKTVLLSYIYCYKRKNVEFYRNCDLALMEKLSLDNYICNLEKLNKLVKVFLNEEEQIAISLSQIELNESEVINKTIRRDGKTEEELTKLKNYFVKKIIDENMSTRDEQFFNYLEFDLRKEIVDMIMKEYPV